MDRFMPRVVDGTEMIAAAVTSIVLTVLSMLSTVLRVHADQTEWAEVASASATAPADHGDVESGGGSTWV
jgi:hypothetical protein